MYRSRTVTEGEYGFSLLFTCSAELRAVQLRTRKNKHRALRAITRGSALLTIQADARARSLALRTCVRSERTRPSAHDIVSRITRLRPRRVTCVRGYASNRLQRCRTLGLCRRRPVKINGCDRGLLEPAPLLLLENVGTGGTGRTDWKKNIKIRKNKGYL